MMYLGDFPTSAMIDFNWSSNASDGASVTRATNGTVSVYKANGTTQSTSGVTDTEDFDGLTGIHHCRIDTSADGTFYAAGGEFSVVLSAATIDGETVNAVLGHFSIERSGGALALLKNATYGLSALETIVDDLEGRLTATRAGYLDNLSAGAVATAAALDAVDNFVDTEVAAVLAAVDTEVAAIKAKTDNLPASPAAVGSAMTLAADAVTAAALAADAGTEIGTAVWATAARTLTAATNVTSTGAAVPITAGGLVSADVTAISTDATAANNAESFFDGTGYAGTNNVIPTVTTVNGLAAGVVNAAAIATGAIDADALAADAGTEIGTAVWATAARTLTSSSDPTAATIADAVWDEARAGHTTAGTFGQGAASVQGNVTGSVGSLAAQAKADVNAEVVDALATDTYGEPVSVPAATASLAAKLGFLAAALRNKHQTTATTDVIRNDADSAAIATAALTEDGTTFTRGEYA